MILPLILICAGFFFLFQNFGWTIDFTYSWDFYWPAVLILIGLVLALKRRY